MLSCDDLNSAGAGHLATIEGGIRKTKCIIMGFAFEERLFALLSKTAIGQEGCAFYNSIFHPY